jgi:hypothetical protein
VSPAVPKEQDEQPARSAAPTTTPADPPSANNLPDLSVNSEDPAALVVSPTVLSVPEPLMRRFEKARRSNVTNTGIVLDALRAHLAELPTLVARARQGPVAAASGATEPFPWRASTTKVRRVQLPIRPLVQQEIGAVPRSLGGRTNRSEVVAAALNAYLPAERRPR